jgi:hypothetical protein
LPQNSPHGFQRGHWADLQRLAEVVQTRPSVKPTTAFALSAPRNFSGKILGIEIETVGEKSSRKISGDGNSKLKLNFQNSRGRNQSGNFFRQRGRNQFWKTLRELKSL